MDVLLEGVFKSLSKLLCLVQPREKKKLTKLFIFRLVCSYKHL